MKKLISAVLCLLLVLSLSLSCFAAQEESIRGIVRAENISKYGNLIVEIDTDAFQKQFAIGDMLEAEFLNQKVEMPFCPAYSFVDSGLPVAIVDEGCVKVAINMGDFATSYKVAVKTTNADKTFFWTFCGSTKETVEITFRLREAKGYYDEYLLRSMEMTNERADYAALSDEEFANFRMITAPQIANGILYRLSSPVDPEINRNTYCDAALKNAGVKTILNLDDQSSELESYEGYSDSYYATINHIELNMGMDAAAADYKKTLGEGLRFLLANEGPYAFSCKEGKNRTGFIAALLEALAGADFDSMADDYICSFYNFYGVKKGTTQYAALEKSFAGILQNAFGGRDAQTADLADCAEQYLLQCGLSKDEIGALKQALAGFQQAEGNFVDVSADSYFCEAVKWASDNGITTGKDKTHFDPYAPVSRAQVVTFLWRVAGCTVVNYWMQMEDVPADAYYAEAVRWALSEKITTGTSETTFSPTKPCTRAEIVTFLWRYSGAEPSGAARSAFIDVLTSDYFWDAVYWAGNGITTGTSPTTFNPYAWCTRAQAVTFLYRLMNAE